MTTETANESAAVPAAYDAGMVPMLSKRQTGLVIAQVCGLSFFLCVSSGIVIIALPAMQATLGLHEGLLVWPSSSYFLTAGSCLLLAGSVTDVVGNKRVNLIGAFLSAVTTLACGLSQTGGEIIAFRAMQGIAYAIITPSSISIISNSVEEGHRRNMGFAYLGFAQPLGFCFGMVLAGVFTDTLGWRVSFYFAGTSIAALFLVGIWALPCDTPLESFEALDVPGATPSVWMRLATEMDGVGVALASSGLAMLSYVLASLSADLDNIRQSSNIVLLTLACLSVPLFVIWMHHQVKNNRPALIPNSLWSNHVFTSLCIMVLLNNALTNSMELYSSLFFQEIQGTSAFGTSLQIVPSLIAGAIVSIVTGIFADRVSVMWVLLAASSASAAGPLLMAVIPTTQPYWLNAFFAQILTPMGCDVLITLGLLLISNIFPKHMQALSGAVFNTCAQLGNAMGLCVTQVVAASVTRHSSYPDKSSPEALMEGYRVAFWTMFGWMVFVCVVCVMGMRRVSRRYEDFSHLPSRSVVLE